MRAERAAVIMLKAIAGYQKVLSGISDEAFDRPQDTGSWTYPQLYSHIIRANLRSLLAIQKCIHRRSAGKGRITLLGWFILTSGKLPPQKAVPHRSTARKINKESARNELLQLKIRIKELLPKVLKCPAHYRVRHPRLGMLNARQWMRFMQIHTCHHLKQLQEMEKTVK